MHSPASFLVATLAFAAATASLSANVPTQTVTVGRDVAVNVHEPVASTSYHWQSSADGGAWSDLSNNATYSGTATDLLMIHGATDALNGMRYRYRATTSSGTTTFSETTTLTVAPALLPFPVAIAPDLAGNLVVADSSTDTIYRVTTAGVVTTIAGTPGLSGSADGAGSEARFNDPSGIVVMPDASIFVTDTANGTIRRISAAGVVTTFAGSTTERGNIDGPASIATFRSPIGIARDSANNLYIADAQNHTIRRITPAGVVSTFAGTPGVSGSSDGPRATARFNTPSGVAVDASGNVYVTDTGNNTVRRINTDGNVVTLAGVAGATGSGDGIGAGALFNGPTNIMIDAGGILYVTDTGNSTVRRVTNVGAVSTYVGLPGIAGLLDGCGCDAWINQPRGVTALNGSLYLADTGNAILRRILSSRDAIAMTLSQGTQPPPGTTPPPTTNPPPDPISGNPNGGGGGGAPSVWFLAALAGAGLLRAWQRRG